MLGYNNAKLLLAAAAAAAVLFPYVAGAIPTCTCGNPGNSSGTTGILLYSASDKCKGASVRRTVQGPPIVTGKNTYSHCFVADPFHSFQLKNTSQYMANYCTVYVYENESCGAGSIASESYAGVCVDTYETGKSFQIECQM